MGDFEDRVKRIEEGQSTGGLAGWWKRTTDAAEARRVERSTTIEAGNIQQKKLAVILDRLKPTLGTANSTPHSLWGQFELVSAFIERKKPTDAPVLVLPHATHRKDLRAVITTSADSEDKFYLGDQQWFSGSGGQAPGDYDIPRGWGGPRLIEGEFTADEVLDAARERVASEFVHQKSRTPWRVGAAATALAVAVGLMKSCDANAQEIKPVGHDVDRPALIEPDTLDR